MALSTHVFRSRKSGSTQSIALYTAPADCLAPRFNQRAGGASLSAETQDLTAGQLTTVLSTARVRRGGHVLGLCLSTRIVAGTQIYDSGTVLTVNTSFAASVYDMTLTASIANNIRIAATIVVGNGAYAHSVTVNIDGVNKLTATSSTTVFVSIPSGTRTIQVIISNGIAGNSGRVVITNAQ